MIILNEELIRYREKNALTRVDLAKRLNISESMIRKVESELRKASPKLAKKWGDELKIPNSKMFKIFFGNKADNMCKNRAI